MTRFGILPMLSLVALLGAGSVAANGPIGDHVNKLYAHLDTYTDEVDWLIERVDEVVATYGERGLTGIEAARVTEVWEEVDFHAAIETNEVSIYASIWQGLFGVRQAMESEQPLAAVRAQQVKLEQSLWQALGAVKLAAQLQQRGVLHSVEIAEATTPLETLDEIKQRLNRVLAKYAERLPKEATEIIHETYLTRFEGLEGMLIEQDASLVEDLELDFNVALPQAIQNGATLDEVRAVVQTMQGKLDRARTLLIDAVQNRPSVF